MFGSSDGRYLLSSVGLIGMEDGKKEFMEKRNELVMKSMCVLKGSCIFESREWIVENNFAIS